MANYPTTPSPQFVHSYEPTWNTLVTNFESGKEQRRKKWSASKTHFYLTYNALSKTNVELIRTHFNGTGYGAYASFSFTHPGETGTPSYTVRYADDGLKISCIDGTNYSVQVHLVQVL